MPASVGVASCRGWNPTFPPRDGSCVTPPAASPMPPTRPSSPDSCPRRPAPAGTRACSPRPSAAARPPRRPPPCSTRKAFRPDCTPGAADGHLPRTGRRPRQPGRPELLGGRSPTAGPPAAEQRGDRRHPTGAPRRLPGAEPTSSTASGARPWPACRLRSRVHWCSRRKRPTSTPCTCGRKPAWASWPSGETKRPRTPASRCTTVPARGCCRPDIRRCRYRILPRL